MTRKASILLAGLTVLVVFAGCRSAHVTSAILYLDQNQFDKAVNVLHEGLDYNPEEPEAFFYLGEAHTKIAEEAVARENDYLKARDNYKMAYEYYVQARDLDPVNLTERVGEALRYSYVRCTNDASRELREDFYESAEGYFRLAYAALPDSTGPIKNIARMKIIQANKPETENPDALLNEALDLLDDVLVHDPDAYGLQADKANVLAKLGRSDEANAIYTELMAEHPDDAALLIDIASLAQDNQEYERAADLYVRVIDIYEEDEDTQNDEQIYELALQAATFYIDSSVGRYADALVYYDRALRLEDNPKESTMLPKLQTHYKYGKELSEAAAAETDPVRKAELEQQAKEQFTIGVNVGNALVNTYFESQNGFFYLALCHNELGDEAAFKVNMDRYQSLSGGL